MKLERREAARVAAQRACAAGLGHQDLLDPLPAPRNRLRAALETAPATLRAPRKGREAMVPAHPLLPREAVSIHSTDLNRPVGRRTLSATGGGAASSAR